MRAAPGRSHLPASGRKPRPAPKLSGIRSLRVWQKLALIPLILLVPIAILLYFFVGAQRNQIAFSSKELRGTRYLQAVYPVLQAISEHQSLTHALLSGDKSFAQLRAQKAAEIEQHLQKLLEIDRKYGAEFQTNQRVQALQQDWQPIKDLIAALSAEDAWTTHERFIERHLLPLVLEVGNNSNLVLDASLDTHYLSGLTIEILPSLAHDLNRLRGYGTGLIARGQVRQEDKNLLQTTLGRARQLLGESGRALDFAFQANPGVQQSLKPLRLGFENGAAETIGAVQTQLLSVTKPSIRARDFYQRTTPGIDAGFELYKASLGQLEQLLQNRLQRLQAALLSSLGIALFLLLGAVVLVWWLTRQITQPLFSLREASLKLAQCDFDFQLPYKGSDELGELAVAFQTSAGQLQKLLLEQQKEQQKALELQEHVRQFLQVATEIARGDLTKRGQVTTDVLGNVVDAVNLTIEEIAHLLKSVKQAAESVNQSATQMDRLTASIAAGALSQAQEVAQVQNQTRVAAHNIRQMAQIAGIAAQAARRTLESAQLGRQAVSQTLSGMDEIRREMQAIAESVAALAQRSDEIESIAKVLEDFASQTNLLALNASFEAAGAGAAGRRFAIVADEIRKLAEESARETSRVNNLVQQLQNEVARVVKLVREGVREVETGYSTANSAGSRLEEIAELAEQSAGLDQEISSLAQSQVSVVERVDQAVQKITQTAQQTGAESQAGRQSAEAMRRLAQELSGNLGRFRLPD